MDNVYQPPQTNLQPDREPSSRFGHFDFGRTFQLAGSAYGQQVGLGVGATLLLPLIAFAMAITIIGIPFGLPVLAAGMPVFGYMMIRREASIGDLFSGFRSYGWVLLAFFLVTVASYIIMLPFSLPQILYLYGDFPFGAIGSDSLGEQMQVWAEALKEKQANPFNPDYLWRVLVSYGAYPITMYIGARLQLLYPLIIIRKMTAIDAIKTSWAVTAPYQWWLMLLYFVAAIIAGAGVLLCFVGLLFSIPFSLALQGAATYQLFGDDTQQPAPQ